jgi:L-histidine N-alpha-methyltransferase
MKITNLLEKNRETNTNEEFAEDILIGLSSTPKAISAKYFYDDAGSNLFQKITEAVDYYPTKKEFAILEKLASPLPEMTGAAREIDVIELGAGDGHKSRLIIDGFLNKHFKVNYYPIDISEEAMHLLRKNISSSDQLKVNGIVAEYFAGLSHVRSLSRNRQLVLFLGSNIGNFDRVHSLKFLRKLWKALDADDFVLIGFDLKKDIQILNRAYNDSEGYTSQFNLNLLTRMNRELGANFVLDQFQHYGFYNPLQGAMESYLLSKEKQSVYIRDLQRSFHFDKFEPIHLEYSFKFSPEDIELLGKQTGFAPVHHFSDAQDYFIDSLWKVKKD